MKLEAWNLLGLSRETVGQRGLDFIFEPTLVRSWLVQRQDGNVLI